ncbi:MAG: hypothetical protein WC057_05640 [Dehalococcoidales bacterium]|jgi:hypothetical protein
MSAISHKRGHEIIYKNNEWVYADNGESANIERPCIKCGCMPTKEGYDACLGYIEGATSACCGHGVEEGYVVYKNKKEVN